MEACWHSTKVLKPVSNPNCFQIYSVAVLVHQIFPSSSWPSTHFCEPAVPSDSGPLTWLSWVSFPGPCSPGSPFCPPSYVSPSGPDASHEPAQVRTQVASPILCKVKERQTQVPSQPVCWHFLSQAEFTDKKKKKSKVLSGHSTSRPV